MLVRERCVVVIVDLQGKLAGIVQDSGTVVANVLRLVRAAKALEIPVVVTEHCPEKIGSTIEEVRRVLPDDPVVKTTFSGWGSPSFRARVSERSQVLLAGIEAHVCVYQTCRDLLRERFTVHVVADAVSSRHALAKDTALQRMRRDGAVITTTEMALFELLGGADHPAFRTILDLVKG